MARVSLPFVLLFLALQLLLISSRGSPDGSDLHSASGRRGLLLYMPSARRDGGRVGEAIPNCREMRSRTECERSSRWCRWCRSDALDDMCFRSSEAWRLPQQVFSCDPTS